MINKIPPKSVHFDYTVHARFSVNTLRLHWYMRFGSPTPLYLLLEDGGSLPASKRVSGTQARSWIEGVWVPRSLQHRRLGPVLWNSQMAVDLLANG